MGISKTKVARRRYAFVLDVRVLIVVAYGNLTSAEEHSLFEMLSVLQQISNSILFDMPKKTSDIRHPDRRGAAISDKLKHDVQMGKAS